MSLYSHKNLFHADLIMLDGYLGEHQPIDINMVCSLQAGIDEIMMSF